MSGYIENFIHTSIHDFITQTLRVTTQEYPTHADIERDKTYIMAIETCLRSVS